jgi:hypothetical protein
MAMTTYLKEKVLNYLFQTDPTALGTAITTLTTNTGYYIGLSLTQVDETGIASVTEPVTTGGSNYARVQLETGTTNYSIAGTQSASYAIGNETVVTFPTAGADWGKALSIFLADTATRATGNVWWYADLSPAITIVTTTAVSFGIGSLVFMLDSTI